MREWLGALLDYDKRKNSELVLTLSDYLECGGNYDDAAAALLLAAETATGWMGGIHTAPVAKAPVVTASAS